MLIERKIVMTERIKNLEARRRVPVDNLITVTATVTIVIFLIGVAVGLAAVT